MATIKYIHIAVEMIQLRCYATTFFVSSSVFLLSAPVDGNDYNYRRCIVLEVQYFSICYAILLSIISSSTTFERHLDAPSGSLSCAQSHFMLPVLLGLYLVPLFISCIGAISVSNCNENNRKTSAFAKKMCLRCYSKLQ